MGCSNPPNVVLPSPTSRRRPGIGLPVVARLAIACAVVACGGPALADGPAAQVPPAAAPISFDRDIRPILSDKCFACHGPDGGKRQAGLRLDLAESAAAALDSGARAIVSGKPAESELLARVESTDPDTVMPPPDAKIGRLEAAEVDLLRRWIAAGAAYEPHWAFVPAARPEPPAIASLPSTADPIDRFVAARLAARGLALEPEADRATLIRRATFDITGLPPTPEEVDAFVNDTAPAAYERLLDRLLASPRYGERMAADWMDLARYSDSYGFQVDRERPMWPWRDWVIAAFNRNLPWDEFTTWQLAGDLLPDATDEQILATGFNRLHQQESEGGSVEEEYRVNYVNDRVTTFGTAFLGLTLECCRCHDHKFDPLSQKEYYQLFAFFDDVDEAGLYSYFTPATPTPKLRLRDPGVVTAMTAADETVAEAEAEVVRAEAAARARVADWLAGRSGPPAEFAGLDAARIPGEVVRYSFDERRADGKFASLVDPPPPPPPAAAKDAAPPQQNAAANAAPAAATTAQPAPPPDHAATSPQENVLVDGRHGRAIRLTGDHPVQTPVGNFRRSDPFTVAAWIHAPARFDRAVVFHRSQAWTDAASRGYEVLVLDGRLSWSLIHFWPGDAVSVRTVEPLPLDRWVHVAVSSDGSGRAAGLRIFVDGRPAATDVVRDCLTREITGGGGDHVRIGERMRDHGFKGGLIDDFRLFDRALAPLEVRELAAPGAITAAVAAAKESIAVAAAKESIAVAAAKESIAVAAKGDSDTLGGWFAAAFDAEAAARRQALREARRARDDLGEKPAEIMVMRELPQPKTAYVLARGEYAQRGEPVGPDTPAILPPFPAGQPRNRLGLARWLTAPDHPLLARVTVNRVWQALFGTGLVKSPEDLGSQSTRPEHPELLDWLAWRFSHDTAAGGLGWNMKALVRSIMLSATYRQRSIADPPIMADDPANLWLARGPRHRLPAEMIRDGALAAAGLLVERVGGPPVNTYDIPESFKPAAAGTGQDLYRRSLYTFWRRTGPAPVLESFDVPKRVVCVAKRDITNTPLHAFVLMNGPQFVEASRVLAEKVLAEAGVVPPAAAAAANDAGAGDATPEPAAAAAARVDAALARAFVLLTSRLPDDAERDILRRMHAEQLAWYRAHPDDAAKLLAIGGTKPVGTLAPVDVAAAAGVINALMNYDGCVVKR